MEQKTIGLLGGMSWESTVPYYRIINQVVADRLGGLHSARVVLWSLDFHEIERLQHEARWDEAGRVLGQGASVLESAGADFLVLCTNTMHMVAPQIQAAVDIPLLHIADATAEVIAVAGMTRVGLLGTRFTMEENFYRGRLRENHGLEVLIPPPEDRTLVHHVIYEELCRGQVRERSRAEFARITADLGRCGARGIILGCTEISLLLRPQDVPIPLFDTTAIHARRAALESVGTPA